MIAKWLYKNQSYLKFMHTEKSNDRGVFTCHVKTRATIHRYSVKNKHYRDSKQGRLYLNNGLNEEIISIRLI